jgi:hypothetical protein
MYTIKLNIGENQEFVFTLEDGGWTSVNSFGIKNEKDTSIENLKFNAAIDAVEAFAIALVNNGFDIEDSRNQVIMRDALVDCVAALNN